MKAMHSPWLNIEHIDRSTHAFAEMQAIGRILSERSPFEESLGASLRPNLGDWRDLLTPAPDLFMDPVLRSDFYLTRGFDPALTDFTVPAFYESVEIAGLRETQEVARDVGNAEAEEDGLARNREAFDRLQRFEIALRRFIEMVMRAAHGDDWMEHQLPNGMLDGWRAKRDTAVTAGQAECPLIDYADFFRISPDHRTA
jgi:hypothetical protein